MRTLKSPIRPRGWLYRQLRLQADGLSGHLDQFWPDVANSAWIGGDAEGWERGPYWLDGMVPLAYALDDAVLIARVTRWVDHILERQHDDGWLGPVHDTSDTRRKPFDPWPVFVLFKALSQFYEEPAISECCQQWCVFCTASMCCSMNSPSSIGDATAGRIWW